MKRALGVVLLLAVSVALPLARGAESPMEPKVKSESEGSGMGMQLDVNYGFVAGSKSHTGGTDVGYVSEQNASLKYVVSPELTKNLFLRAGLEWNRFSFGLPSGAPLPNTLQQISGIVGFDCQLSEQWLLRLEVQPGLYSDFKDLNFHDLNAPVILGASYLVDSNLQWFLGLRMDPRSRYWIAPAAGVRWKFADEWTLNFLFPEPRLEYDLNKQWQLYLGGRILGGTYRLAEDFGDSHSADRRLNDTTLDFLEVRVGPGVSWKILPNLTIEAEAGCMVYREFEFNDPHMFIRSNRPAPYAQISCHASF
ncbi:MAG: DUF6268 family outer membrane beta-barrel protein [Verrucomicrobia bacterium]|nr:DUF6268 family outer membrane beta-barrel protein [Verrucomicrobiota bacterium]